MTDSPMAFEAPSLGEALQAASTELGVGAEMLDYSFDREHFTKGAHTVRIFVKQQDPVVAQLKETSRTFFTNLLEEFRVRANLKVEVADDSVKLVGTTGNARGILDDEAKALRAAEAFFSDLNAELLAGRSVTIELTEQARERSSRGDDDRGGRGRDRGDRGDRGGRGGRGRDRGDRGDRGGRGGRGRDRDRGGDRESRSDETPEEREERDNKLKQRARDAIEAIGNGGEPVRISRLNSYERRLVHLIVKEVDGVDSRSVGRGSRKAVEIFGEQDD